MSFGHTVDTEIKGLKNVKKKTDKLYIPLSHFCKYPGPENTQNATEKKATLVFELNNFLINVSYTNFCQTEAIELLFRQGTIFEYLLPFFW